MPSLTITEHGKLVRLNLGGLAHGEGSSLQEAGDDLIRRVLEVAAAFRAGGYSTSREVAPDLETMSFLHELADLAAGGGDIRARVFG